MLIRLLPALPLLWSCSSSKSLEIADFDPTHPISTARPVQYDKPGKRPGPDGAFLDRLSTMKNDDGTITADGISIALAHREQALAADFDTGGIQRGSWNWLGPGNVGGRTRGLWIRPSRPDEMVLGSASGGIWRTDNGGLSWDAVHDYPASLAIGCMAGPKGSNYVVWAGTGEGFGNPDAIRGAGIYRSIDAGRTFKVIPRTTNFNFNFVNRIAFHPSNARIVLVGTGTGIWRTTDGGGSFTRVSGLRCLDLKFHPTNGYLAIAGGSSQSGVRYSLDAGLTWRTATGLPTQTRRVELAYARSNPGIVYASVEMAGGASRVYRSTNGGKSYLLRSATGILGAQGWYDNAVWVDPTNSNIVVVGGIGNFRSYNGGASFVDIGGGHPDQHVIMEHPRYNGTTNKTVFVCNDGGIYRTDDIRATSSTIRWRSLNNRLGITQFYDGAVSASGRPHGGTQDNGTLQLSSSLTKSFRQIWGRDGLQCEADPTNANVLFGEDQYVGVFRSMTGGNTAERIVNNLADVGVNNGAPWSGAMRLDPNNPNRLWMGTIRLWRSDNAKTATAANVRWRLARSVRGPYSAVEVAPSNSNIVVIGTYTGQVYRSTNATAANPSWAQIDRGVLPRRRITRIRIDRINPNKIYLAFGGFSSRNVYHSSNGGGSWAPVSGAGSTGLPPAPVRGLALHPTNEGWIYAGTEVGIYASTDNGRTWSSSNDGPATVSVDDIEIRKNGAIFAFTYGRGVYRAHAGMPQDPLAGTTRVSRTWLGQQSNGHSYRTTLNQDGRWVGFDSLASNLVPLDTNSRRDVFVRDRQAGTTERVSVSTTGRQSNGDSVNPAFAAGGRHIAFESTASNLITGDTNGRRDIFVRDRTTTQTRRASVGFGGLQANNHSYAPSMSDDGRYTAFYSYATNLVSFADTNNTADVFVQDAATLTTRRVSTVGLTSVAAGASYVSSQALSGDGSKVVFYSFATNLVSGDTNAGPDIFFRDYNRGSTHIERINVGPGGAQARGSSYLPTISADGRWVAFYSTASNLVAGDTNGRTDVFLRDVVGRRTYLISRQSRGGALGNQNSYNAQVSRDGQWVTFESSATNLVPNDRNGRVDVFAYKIATGDLFHISKSSTGVWPNQNCSNPVISGDGKYIGFFSSATNLVQSDTNAAIDVFVAETGMVQAVFPTAAATRFGNTSTALPLSTSNTRLQQVYRETKRRSMGIRRVSFRRAAGRLVSASLPRTIELNMFMGGCDIDSFGSNFDRNWAGLRSEVITRKQISIPDWRAQPVGLSPFNASLPLDRMYQHSPTRQLMFEIRSYANSRSGGHITDGYIGNLSVYSTSQAFGIGCTTNTGKNFSHSLLYSSTGTSTNLRLGMVRAPASAPVTFALGMRNPNLQLPGWCTRLYTDAVAVLPVGRSDAAGKFNLTMPLGAYNPRHTGLVLHTQCYAATGAGFFSQGLRLQLPSLSPGPVARRLFASSRTATTGTLQNMAAIVQFEY